MADGIRDVMDKCWHRIGVWGRESPRCPKLERVIHCHNCEVFHAASLQVYERALPEDYRREWTEVLAGDKEEVFSDAKSVIVFRLGEEWVALSTSSCKEISQMLKIHRLPHNKSNILRGVVNTGGEVQICFSLGGVLGTTRADKAFDEGDQIIYGRMITLEKDGKRYVFPVSEIAGIYHYREAELEDLPSTVSDSASNYIKGIIKWGERHIGCLDEGLLISRFERSIR